MYRIFILMILVVIVANPASGLDEMAKVEVKWAPSEPEPGTTIETYHVYIRFWNPSLEFKGVWGEVGSTSKNVFIMDCYRGFTYKVKVIAEDSNGKFSIASPESEALLIPGASQLSASQSKVVPAGAGKPKIKGP